MPHRILRPADAVRHPQPRHYWIGSVNNLAFAAAVGQTWDLPVPAQEASAHARFFDHAGLSRRSRGRVRPCCLPPSQQRRRPGCEFFTRLNGWPMHSPTEASLSPCGRLRTAQGRCGSLLLHRVGLGPTTPCRSSGALRKLWTLPDNLLGMTMTILVIQRRVCVAANELWRPILGFQRTIGSWTIWRSEISYSKIMELLSNGRKDVSFFRRQTRKKT